jgi:excisionase family DNA binding protein
MSEKIVPSLEDPLLPVDEVATMFGVEQHTIRTWIREDKIKATKILGRWRIQKSEVIRIANKEYGE